MPEVSAGIIRNKIVSVENYLIFNINIFARIIFISIVYVSRSGLNTLLQVKRINTLILIYSTNRIR